jgi:2-dehydropantoate 2-reductase
MRNRTGAIGGLLAAKLAHAGERLSVITRGTHLARIVETGLRLIEERPKIVARVAANDRIADVGEQDPIILGMKAHEVAVESGCFPRDQAGDRRHQGQ